MSSPGFYSADVIMLIPYQNALYPLYPMTARSGWRRKSMKFSV
jgi:hypothetical protein